MQLDTPTHILTAAWRFVQQHWKNLALIGFWTAGLPGLILAFEPTDLGGFADMSMSEQFNFIAEYGNNAEHNHILYDALDVWLSL
ncbi:MAG: hypothetical protein H6765_10940 [Candidatus Peribacteria bacterium]|nr:MAG: hypothetical protein H6765_10940 [Candidatus Peribacteria bacterium]